MKVMVMHKLKKGKTIEQYRKYSKELDQPDIAKSHVIKKFEVYEIDETESGVKPPYDILEIMTVDDWESFLEEEYSEGHKSERQMWLDEWVEEGSLITMYGDEITI
jgi:hypothetical protein